MNTVHVSDFSEVRRSVIVCPAALKTNSLAALEAGTLRILRAKTANLECEQQCEIELIYGAQKVEQISGYLFIDTCQIKYMLAWMKWGWVKTKWVWDETTTLGQYGVLTPVLSVLR